MNRLIREVLRWRLGDLDARILLSELDEKFRKLEWTQGKKAANRWRRRELRRAVFLASLFRPTANPRNCAKSVRFALLGSLAQDLRFCLRSFARKPAFFAVVLSLFALGIGANTVIFSVVDSVVLRPLPYFESDRLVTTYLTIPDWLESDNPGLRVAWNRLLVSYPVYEDWLEMNDVFESFGLYSRQTYVASDGDEAEWITGQSMTHGVFAALGAVPMVGRVFVPGDDVVGGPPLVVLSHGIWQWRFGADSAVIGQTMRLDEQRYEVAGVTP